MPPRLRHWAEYCHQVEGPLIRIDRWVGAATRYDADATAAAFAARLQGAVGLDAVCDDLARVVHQALEPASVSVWITHGS